MTGPCPCERAVALRDVAERIARSIERNGQAPAGAFEAWVRERDQLACPCRREQAVAAGAEEVAVDAR